MASSAAGRACPVSYRYAPEAVAKAVDLEVDTLWVAGGLYGNPFALERLLERFEDEPGDKALLFNGDFHWFDADPQVFRAVDREVARHRAIRGNVETELASPAHDAGCGCAYPEWVDDGTVERSNRIIERLRKAALACPDATGRMRSLPMHACVRVGQARIAVVHGDYERLAGWGLSQEALGTDRGRAAAERAFARSGADIFASSHTCLPVLQRFCAGTVVVNNGAAGMPNFRGTRYGVATRISLRESKRSLYGVRARGVHIEALAIDYDHAAWQECFLAQWPAGSDAYLSYWSRIVSGPAYDCAQALRAAARLVA